MCRYTALNRTVWAQVESLVYFLLFPVLLFHSIVKSPLDLRATSSLMGAGWALVKAKVLAVAVLATRMGYDGAYVAGLVTLSTLLGLASLPFALGVLRQF